MYQIVRKQLSIDYNCSPDDFLCEDIRFFALRDHPERRRFPRQEQHTEIVTMNGLGAVVCAEERLLPVLRERIIEKRDSFEMVQPFGSYVIYFLPELDRLKPAALPDGFTYKWYENEKVYELYAHPGFRNALSYDPEYVRPDVIALTAWKDGKIAGMAAASEDCASMWQVGIDVLASHRGRGLASALVNRLTLSILEKDIVPYYGANYSNIASQRTAYRAGYLPMWAHTYRSEDAPLIL